MTNERKMLLVTRHGRCPRASDGVNSLDSLLPESFGASYRTGASLRNFVREQGVTPRETFLRYSEKKRTQYTGETILIGAFGMQPEPENPEDLVKYRQELASQGVDAEALPMLGYNGVELSIDGVKQDGENQYISNWMADPRATKYHNGESISPFQECLETRSQVLADALKQLAHGDKKLGVVASHAGLVDAIVAGALNSSRRTPINNTEQYGQHFEQGESATILLNQTDQGYKATLVRDGQTYETDLNHMLKYPGQSVPEAQPQSITPLIRGK